MTSTASTGFTSTIVARKAHRVLYRYPEGRRVTRYLDGSPARIAETDARLRAHAHFCGGC